MGTAFVHTVIDWGYLPLTGAYSRVAYAEIHDDETSATATTVLRNAVSWFTARGVTVERVLSDNGSCYRSHLWRDTCRELGVTPKKTRPTHTIHTTLSSTPFMVRPSATGPPSTAMTLIITIESGYPSAAEGSDGIPSVLVVDSWREDGGWPLTSDA